MPVYDAVDHLLIIQECYRIIICFICWLRCKLLLRLKIRWLGFELVVLVFLMEVPMCLVHFILHVLVLASSIFKILRDRVVALK